VTNKLFQTPLKFVYIYSCFNILWQGVPQLSHTCPFIWTWSPPVPRRFWTTDLLSSSGAHSQRSWISHIFSSKVCLLSPSMWIHYLL